MRILIATDGSGGSVDAARLIGRLQLAAEDRVALAGVAEAPPDGEAWCAPEREALAGTRATIEITRPQGSLQEAIIHLAAEWKADLLAVGPRVTRVASKAALSRPSECISRHAPCPVLIGRPLRFDLQRAMVCVDRSPMAARIVNEACELCLPGTTELTLLTVLPPVESRAAMAPVVWSSLPNRVDSLLKAASQEADDRLRSLAGLLKSQYPRVRAEVYRGDPATVLAGIPDKERTDLMILGTLGEGGMERLLLGSVSDQIARQVSCSVLLVR